MFGIRGRVSSRLCPESDRAERNTPFEETISGITQVHMYSQVKFCSRSSAKVCFDCGGLLCLCLFCSVAQREVHFGPGVCAFDTPMRHWLSPRDYNLFILPRWSFLFVFSLVCVETQ